MKVLRWLWFLVGVYVALQYLYWFVMTVAHSLGWAAAPVIPTFWIAMSLASAFLLACDCRSDEIKKLLG